MLAAVSTVQALVYCWAADGEAVGLDQGLGLQRPSLGQL